MTIPVIHWRGESIPMLVVGTAQMGIPGYGVANSTEGMTEADADAIVLAAKEVGVSLFDTAQAYGDSEERLGRAFSRVCPHEEKPDVVTKLDPGLTPEDRDGIERALTGSMTRLGMERLWGVMLHRFSWLEKWDEGLGDCLRDFKAAGKIGSLGVSVYTADEALAALKHPDMDIVQIPANAWDNRMERAGVFEIAEKQEKLLFIRSVFLQGLLLLDPTSAEAKVKGAGIMAAAWRNLCAERGYSPFEMALRWAAGWKWPLVVGVDGAKQFSEIAQAVSESRGRLAPEVLLFDFPIMENVLDPVMWSMS